MRKELSVDFSHNQYHCHCHKGYDDVISMIHWMRDTNVNLLNANTYECTGHEQVELLLEKDTDIYRDMCSITEEIIQTIVSSVLACIFVFLLTIIIRMFFKRRHRLKTWYYRRKIAHHKQTGDQMEFDIYICYDDDDKSYVIYELSHILESVYNFRCCLPERDFHGEGVHNELIGHFMSKCQMSIVVLSRQALQNPIHFMERNLARQRELHSFQMKKVIYIFLEDLSDVTDCDDRNTNDVSQIIRNKLGLVYKDESVDKKTAFYDHLGSKIYRNLFSQSKQSQG